MRVTMKSSQREQTMNATRRSTIGAGLVVCSAVAFALTGCRTYVVHEPTRTVYAPPPPPVVYPSRVPAPVYVPPPPVVVVEPPEPTPVVVIHSENDFYEPLATYGRWVVVGAYGRCWIPARVEAGWRPYSNGYWQRTDAGWYWASDEPWGWATYHYGRWDFNAEFGWVWVPQTQWAPAWVSWREGGNYVGWAPLRPSERIEVNVRVGDYEPAFASRAFVFVEHRRMLEPVRPKTVIVNNTTVINQTVNITNVKIVNRTVINEGPRVEVIEQASGRKVQAVQAREFRHREETAVLARERNLPTDPRGGIQSPARTEPRPVPAPVIPTRNGRTAEHAAEVVTQPAQPNAAPVPPTPPRREAGKPARDERKHEAENGRVGVATTPKPQPAARPETRQERRPPVKVEPAPTLGGARGQIAPRAEEPNVQPLLSPRGKSRAAEQGEAKKKPGESKGQKKKGEEQETDSPHQQQ